jgi:hypothetical protein
MPRPKWRFIKAEFDGSDNAGALFDPVLARISSDNGAALWVLSRILSDNGAALCPP